MSYANQKVNKNPLPAMPEDQLEKLDELLQIQSSSDNEKMIYFYLRTWLNDRNISHYTDEEGNLIAQKGDGNMQCIVSHMDTVHKIFNDYRVLYKLDIDGNLIAYAKSGKQNAGVKGDDQCGIFACLYMLENMEKIKVVFFSREEVGLIGSSNISDDVFHNCGSIVQLDRWGSSDFISIYNGWPTINDEFREIAKPLMEDYHYHTEEGLITDSINLFDNYIGLSCVNISCGYYSHHSNNEIIDVNELWNSVRFTHELLVSLGDEKYEKFPYTERKKYNSNEFYGSSRYKDVWWSADEDKIKHLFTKEDIELMREYEPYIDDYLNCDMYDNDAIDFVYTTFHKVEKLYGEYQNNI